MDPCQQREDLFIWCHLGAGSSFRVWKSQAKTSLCETVVCWSLIILACES